MSLNKFTNTQRGKDLNLQIGCGELDCDELKASNVELPLIEDPYDTFAITLSNGSGNIDYLGGIKQRVNNKWFNLVGSITLSNFVATPVQGNNQSRATMDLILDDEVILYPRDGSPILGSCSGACSSSTETRGVNVDVNAVSPNTVRFNIYIDGTSVQTPQVTRTLRLQWNLMIGNE